MRQVRLWVAVIICGLGFAMTPMAKAADAPATQPVDDAGKGKVVGLDYYFNHQLLKGQQYHYIWEDTASSRATVRHWPVCQKRRRRMT